MTFSFTDFEAALKAGASVTADDVLALRRWVWPDGVISHAEAESLFALARAARETSPEWDAFLVEAISEHVLKATDPEDYVDDATSAWLIGQIESCGTPAAPVMLDLVATILEKALNAPAALKTWALKEIETAILTGKGATRNDGPLRPGCVDAAEVKWLRRLVFAAGGDGALTVDDSEADMLWRLKDATLHADNAPEWKTLFVQAVGNHLMAWSSYKPLERGEAARLESFMNDRHRSLLGFFGRMDSIDLHDAERVFAGDDISAAGHRASVHAAAAVTPAEQGWLQSHIDADGARDPYEEALLAFIGQEKAKA
jgi:hypothetical protein